MKATVIIPTTTRPVLITGLQEKPGLKASMVVAEGDFRGLAISDDYDRLIGVSGPLAAVVGRPGLPPHMLRLSHAFESGRSWEVPVCIAHFLSSRGVTLVGDPAEADLVCWATGAVDSDLSIVVDRYFLDQKLTTGLDLLRKVPAKALTVVLLPKGNDDDRIAATTHAALRELDASLSTISSVDGATAAIQKLVGSLGPAGGEGNSPARREGGVDKSKVPVPQRVASGDDHPAGGRRWLMALTVFLLASVGLAWGAARVVLGPTWYTIKTDAVGKKGAGSDRKVAADTRQDGLKSDAKDASKRTDPKSDVGTKSDTGPGGSVQEAKSDATVVATGPSEPRTGNDGTPTAPPVTSPTDSGSTGSANGVATPPPGSPSESSAPPGPGSGSAPPAPASTAADAPRTETPADKVETLADPKGEPKVEPKADDKGEVAALTGNDSLLIVEEWRAPAQGSCQDLLYQSQRPQVSVLKPSGGRLQPSPVQGLCALVFRLGDGGKGYSIVVDRRLAAMTMDAPPGAFGRGERRAGEVMRFFRGRDSGQGLTYDVVLKPSNPSTNSGEVKFTHELRR